MSTNYSVVFADFAERHFIKSFKKKYKNAWDYTLAALRSEFENFDLLFQKSIAEKIYQSSVLDICKTEFRIAGTDVSRRASGNRCIVAIHKETNTVHVLLVYHKNDIGDDNETSKWKSVIKANFPQYKQIL
ncbi:MAG: hypothetical protein KBC69_00615 [Candidatus Magasanikbacteria bacterium]|nr:hypothetical protein [Candidatus Magasanikbacteria bacterium]